jgi:hypothetical protein
MTHAHQPLADLPDSDQTLADLTEQISFRLQAGERVHAEDYARRYPAYASLIRWLLPALRILVAFGRATERDPRREIVEVTPNNSLEQERDP